MLFVIRIFFLDLNIILLKLEGFYKWEYVKYLFLILVFGKRGISNDILLIDNLNWLFCCFLIRILLLIFWDVESFVESFLVLVKLFVYILVWLDFFDFVCIGKFILFFKFFSSFFLVFVLVKVSFMFFLFEEVVM